MPYYTYKIGDDEVTLGMSISEMEEYEKANPSHVRVYKPVVIGDPVLMGVKKPPSDFDKYVLGRIKENSPNNTIEKKRSIAREF